MADSESIKVFISYSHDSDAHMNRILALSDRLRAEGVDCEIDQYEISPAGGWPRWTRNKIKEADYVLIICTKIYEQRYEASGKKGVGAGAKWEGAIITQQIYDSEGDTHKFIPVVFSAEDTKYIPIELRAATHYNLSDEHGYENLYWHITGQPKAMKRRPGKVRSRYPKKRVQDFTTAIEETRKEYNAEAVTTVDHHIDALQQVLEGEGRVDSGQDAIKQGEPVHDKPPGIQEPSGDPRNEPIKTPWVRVILVTSLTALLLSLAFHTGFFGLLGLDNFIDRRFRGYADNYVDKSFSKDAIAIISIEEDPDKNGGLGKFGADWRGHHADLIRALSAAKAKVIAFDMSFEADSSENDEELGRAIQSAARSGTKVILGSSTFRTIDDRQVPQITQRLATYLDKSNWALLNIGRSERGSSLIGNIKLGYAPSEELPREELPLWISIQRQQIVPSLPLQAAMHFWADQQQPIAVFDSDRDQIDVQTPSQVVLRSIPVTSAMDFTFDIADKSDLSNISHPYHVVLGKLNNRTDLSNTFGGKIVMVGVRAADDFWTVSLNEKQYGVEILAGVTSNLVQGVHIQPLSRAYQYIIIFVMSCLGALLPTLFGNFIKYRIPIKPLTLAEVRMDIPLAVGAVCLLYMLLAFFVYVQARRTMSIQYHLAALIVTFILVKVTTRSSQTQPSREAT